MRRELRGQKIGFGVLLLATLLVVIPVAAIVALVIAKGWGALSWEFLFSMPRDGMRAGGIFPAIIGTVYLVFISLAFALPIGVMAAIYLTEYAKDNLLTRIINLAIINLAGVSSVVFGLFGLSLFVVFLKFGVSIISGALTLGSWPCPSSSPRPGRPSGRSRTLIARSASPWAPRDGRPSGTRFSLGPCPAS